MKKDYKQILSTLQELHIKYPEIPLSMHLDIATADYNGSTGLSDKELAVCLRKYITLQESAPRISEDYIQQLEEDARNMFKQEDYEL